MIRLTLTFCNSMLVIMFVSMLKTMPVYSNRRISDICHRAEMAKTVTTLASVKSCSTLISLDRCSTVGADMGSNPTPSIVFNMLRVMRQG